MGAEFLLSNAISDIPIPIMKQIKKEAFDRYLPNDRRPIKAWGLAMASLRCLKRDLIKSKNKQLLAAAAAGSCSSTPETAINNDDEPSHLLKQQSQTNGLSIAPLNPRPPKLLMSRTQK